MSAVEATSPGGLLQVIDDAFLAAVKGGEEGCVTPIEVTREKPYLDIEVLSNPYVDAPTGDGAGLHRLGEGPAADFVARYEEMRKPFEESPPDIVISRGTPVVAPPPDATGPGQGEAHGKVWESALEGLAESSKSVLCVHSADPVPAAEELAAVYRLDLRGKEQGDQATADPLAYVVVLGWFGQLARGEAVAAGQSERLIRALTTSEDSIARNAPLHVICVPAVDGEHDRVLRECERLRVSLVLAGTFEQPELIRLSRAGLRPLQAWSSVGVLRCPSFRPGTAASGMARVRVNAWKGEAEVAFRRDLGSDRPSEPVQLVSPMHSASRVSNSERRLYHQAKRLLDKGREDAAQDTERAAAVQALGDDIRDTWQDSGYVTLGNDEGRVPLVVTRHTRYNLLLLVRERGDGYDVLLSNHSPLRPSLISDWNTLLLPAFKDVRALLEHLRDDVVRQVRERAESFERTAHARAFERAVEEILEEGGESGDDLWADEVREIASNKIRKISPTTGEVTECDYRLVTLLPLVDRSIARAIDDEAGPEQSDRLRNRRRVIEWLNGLDTVVAPVDSEEPGLSLAALQANGCAVRWDPRAGLSEVPSAADRRRTQTAPPGAIWFPLSAAGEDPLWRTCPSIASRNADVMSWVEKVLDKERTNGELPSQLLLGRHPGGSDAYELDGDVFPFEGGQRADDPDVPGKSTVDALRQVRFIEESDLAEERAYDQAEVKRVYLVREDVPVGDADRQGIFVYEAMPGEPFGPEVRERGPLGMLRPVQRYVLKAGLERAREIREKVRPKLREAEDEWGFVRVRKGGAPQAVSITPPIIEQLHRDDWDDCSRESDFIVCDGNHRIVEGVWRSDSQDAMPAVAITGKLRQPYYARPFGRLEWEATAENEQVVTPELASKYLVRKVLERDLEALDPEALAKLDELGEASRYRRYYRDLTTGFGYMGGQGGRYV